ncbi:hypothetical protein [Glycomyces salinus]|uniref:hypothetical protein n=1 Tax=Glycomyces salinus TaxID=980294 RepID=UPI0018EA84DA|nr:hypothetical protein [Glycomyces salinus]
MRHKAILLGIAVALIALPAAACDADGTTDIGDGTEAATTEEATESPTAAESASESPTAADPTTSDDGLPPYDRCGARIVELREFSTIAEQESDDLRALAEEWDEHAETTIDEGLALTARDVADQLQHAVENQDLYYPGTPESLELASLLEDYATACDNVGR